MRNLLRTLVPMFLVACVATIAWSSEADELRAKAKAMHREAEQLTKEGRREEAEKLGRAIKELLQAADKHDQKSAKPAGGEIEELHHRLKALAEKENALKESKNEEGLAEVRKHRAAIERELAELKEHQGRKAGVKQVDKQATKTHDLPDDAARRIKHIQIAVENLHAAGLHDIAKEVAKQAEATEREIRQAHERATKESPAPKKAKQPEPEAKHEEPARKQKPETASNDELAQELKRLRAELNELREEIKNRK